ncbi:MAG TPA: diaminopimelate decarboxylase [Gammaproteobacteria bacterium]|nr:diaminopimelate decarboxylase [Gammaproteobacteria bacterium]
MTAFAYSHGLLCAEGVSLPEIAERYGTPTYIYSRAAIEERWQAFEKAFGDQSHLICYAVKANSSLAVLNLLARLGSGFDIVSAGELERVLRAGGEADRIVFSGVGKRFDEIRRALDVGIKCFNVESTGELDRINQVGREQGKAAPVSIRVNPDVDAQTHPYIATGLKENKFGIPYDDALSVYELAVSMEAIQVIGIDCHIGSQITAMAPFRDTLMRLMELIDEIENITSLSHVDIGGGLGIRYRDENPPEPEEYVREVCKLFAGRDCEIVIEPGRSILGNAGVLLTRVEYLKQAPERNFAIVDAAMTENLRPSLYDAWHDILPVVEPEQESNIRYDIVGPVCESADILGRDRRLLLQPDDLLAIMSIGAYGFSMSSTYNSRPRACEIMVDGETVHVIRRRETVENLMEGESVLPED